MIELQTRTYRRKIAIAPGIIDSFRSPIVFYLAHKDDAQSSFPLFVILDFSNSEIIYIVSYLPENIEIMKNHPDRGLFQAPFLVNMHCSLQVTPGKEFLSFVDYASYIFSVDYENNIMRLFSGKDLLCNERNNITYFGSTFYKDENDDAYFYFSACGVADGQSQLYMYRSRLDLTDIKTVAVISPYHGIIAPHMTRVHQRILLNSLFTTSEFVINATGQKFDLDGIMQYVYEDLFKDYCATKQLVYSHQIFEKNNTIKNMVVRLDPEFSNFCKKIGKKFVDLTNSIEKYRFTALPGKIFSVNIDTSAVDFYDTTMCSPAHFELFDSRGDVYVSCHNMAHFGAMHYLGPAVIDKFRVHEGKMIKMGSFCNPRGFRFTSHRLFTYNGRQYICTIGYPNRLFFIEADTMKLLYHYDIDKDVLSSLTDICTFLNTYYDYANIFYSFEVSSENGIVLILGIQDVYFYDFNDKRVIQKIPYLVPVNLEQELNLDKYYRRTSHSSYLQ